MELMKPFWLEELGNDNGMKRFLSLYSSFAELFKSYPCSGRWWRPDKDSRRKFWSQKAFGVLGASGNIVSSLGPVVWLQELSIVS
jgi:hypothetical protein